MSEKEKQAMKSTPPEARARRRRTSKDETASTPINPAARKKIEMYHEQQLLAHYLRDVFAEKY